MRTRVDYQGEELSAEKTGEGWRVELGGRDVEAKYLDYALAELLGVRSAHAISLAVRILQSLPTEETEEDPGP